MMSIDVLVPFNLIVDTDYGLTKVIHDEYNDYDFFYKGLVDADGTDLKYLLQIRDVANPVLNMMIDGDNEELGDKLYNQFIEREYDKILEKSCTTGLVNLANILKKNINQIVKITILCSCQEEIECLNKLKVPYFKTLITNPEQIDLSEYNALFVKNIKDLDRYRNVVGKAIYIPCYKFNVIFLEDDPNPIIDPEYMLKYGRTNEISVFTLYILDPRKIPLP